MPFYINELGRRGVRLPSIEEFSAGLVSMQVAEDDCWISESGEISDTSVDLLLPRQG